MIIGCFNEKNGDLTINYDGFMGDSWVFDDGDISYFWGFHGILRERSPAIQQKIGKSWVNLNHPWS